MDKQELIALAERVEKLEGPNYAMEIEIFKALHPEYADYVQGRGGLVHPCDGSDVRVLSDVRPPNYTASIDAAITLVPEPGEWQADTLVTGGRPGRPAWFRIHSLDYINQFESDAVTMPLAICAASIRAIAEQEGK